MTRTFDEWWKTLPKEMKNNILDHEKRPPLSQINYLWITNLINKKSSKQNPTTAELLEWIKSGQIDALRR